MPAPTILSRYCKHGIYRRPSKSSHRLREHFVCRHSRPARNLSAHILSPCNSGTSSPPLLNPCSLNSGTPVFLCRHIRCKYSNPERCGKLHSAFFRFRCSFRRRLHQGLRRRRCAFFRRRYSWGRCNSRHHSLCPTLLCICFYLRRRRRRR